MARTKKAPAGARNMKLFYGVLALVAVVGIGAIVYSMKGAGQAATAPVDLSQIADAGTLLQRAQGVTLGEPNAPVEMLVFSDYQCPACAVWAGQIEPVLKPEFVQTGKVRITYYDFPLVQIHKHAFLAARAGRCALDQNKFWEYHDRVFGGQNQWGYSQSAPIDLFVEYAQEIGLDRRAFEGCVRSDRHADVVTANQMLGQNLGVGGTPTVYVNGRKLGDREWQDYGAVKAAVQAAGGV